MLSWSKMVKCEHGEHGWFKPGERAYAPLMKSDAVQLLAKSFPSRNRATKLYQLKHFLEVNQVGPEEVLQLSDAEIKKSIKRAVLTKNEKGSYAAARNLFYVVRRFLELNGREISFNRSEKLSLLKRRPKKIAKQYIPSRDDIYRMGDSFPNKGPRQKTRGQALILCLWQSGVRSSCLCSWTWGMFKDKLWPAPKIPVPIKVVAYRPPGVTDCAQDTKLSSYAVDYYYTFLHEEAAWALKLYLDERIADGWKPDDVDPVFVTEGTASKGGSLNPQHVVEIVKTAAQQIGLDPESIWTHCFRKSFRKTLYRGGVDPDVAEALMGHKLPASRGSYFDYHDLRFASTEYMRGFWQRMDVDRLRELEEEVGRLRAREKELNGVKAEIEEKKSETEILQKRVQELSDSRSIVMDMAEEMKKLKAQVTELQRTLVKRSYQPLPQSLGKVSPMTDEEADEIIATEEKMAEKLRKHGLYTEAPEE
jgi:integrase